jgi:hypothetical protein
MVEYGEKVCASTCRSNFGLSDVDLARINVEFRRNPRYRRSAPMRLYRVEDVRDLDETVAQEREERRQREVTDAIERAARESRSKDDARAALEAYGDGGVTFGAPATGIGLPLDVVEAIAEDLACTSDVNDELRGPLDAARDLANFACTCREFRTGAVRGFDAMAVRAPPMPPNIDWVRVFHDPRACKVDELKLAARSLGVSLGGTKAVLFFRIVGANDVAAMPAAPPSVVCAVALDRRARLTSNHPIARALPLGRRVAPEVLALSRDLFRVGTLPEAHDLVRARFGTLAAMRRHVARVNDVWLEGERVHEAEREAERVAKAEAVRASFMARSEPFQAPRDGDCVCGQTASPTCANGRCGTCCRRLGRVCSRHGVMSGTHAHIGV